jgi:acetyl-CoA synthetase
MVAGEVIDPEHFTWFFRTFGRGQTPVINYTGGTEASGALLGNVPVRPIKASAFNSPSPGVPAYVADANGQRVREQVGELTIGAPFIGMTRGFWHDDARYLESYWNIVPGVWTHGDFVYEDSDGHFFVLGRSDDTLKIAGKRVGPAEIEAVLLELPELREVAAIGIPDPAKGQQLVICAVPASDSTQQESLAGMMSDRIETALGKPFKPAQIHVVANLPKTRNGKIMRRVIRSILCQQPLGDLSSLDNPESIQLLRALDKHHMDEPKLADPTVGK